MIISIGDIMLDIYISEPGELNADTDTAGATALAWGGSAANFAVWCSRLGMPTGIAGRTGHDFVGGASEEDFRKEGVTPFLAQDADLPTGTVVVRSRGGVGREMICDRKANMNFSPSDLPLKEISQASWVHISGYTAIEPLPRAAVMAAIRAAKAFGVPVSIDPGSCSLIGGIGPERFLDAVRGADFIFPNLDEARLLAGDLSCTLEPEELAAKLTGRFPAVVVKLGPGGALFADASGKQGRVSSPETVAVDTNGAGDAFAAGFVASYVSNHDMEKAVSAGCGLGALVVSGKGARPAVDLGGFLDEHFPAQAAAKKRLTDAVEA